jgi:hypothetical protein
VPCYLLYLLITGQTIFNNNQEDNLDEEDLVRLCKWNDADLQATLRKVHNPKRGKYQPLGRDLLERLLQPEAGERPKTMQDVLDHPFFVGESLEEFEKKIKELEMQLVKAEAGAGGSGQVETILRELEDLKRTQQRIEKGVEEANEKTELDNRNQENIIQRISELKVLAKDTNTVAKDNSQKLTLVVEKLCGLEQMGLDQIKGKHKCPGTMLLMWAEDEIPPLWTDVWDMIETEEEARLTELEEQRKGLQAQAAELVESMTQVIPPKKARGRGFFARKHTGGTGAEATAETIDILVTNTTEVTQGFVGWVEGMGGVFEIIYTRAKTLHEGVVAVEVKKVAELVKLAIIITKDISNFFKDLRQWYRFVFGALKQRKKGAKNTERQLTQGAKKAKEALEELQHIRKQIHGNITQKLLQALEFCNSTDLKRTCDLVVNTFTAEEPPLDEYGDDGDGDGEGEGGNSDDGDGGDDGGQDFMSDMKSYCFRKFGKVAEGKLNKRAKIYDKVQIHLLCEYGKCHVPDGIDMPTFLYYAFYVTWLSSVITRRTALHRGHSER